MLFTNEEINEMCSNIFEEDLESFCDSVLKQYAKQIGSKILERLVINVAPNEYEFRKNLTAFNVVTSRGNYVTGLAKIKSSAEFADWNIKSGMSSYCVSESGSLQYVCIDVFGELQHNRFFGYKIRGFTEELFGGIEHYNSTYRTRFNFDLDEYALPTKESFTAIQPDIALFLGQVIEYYNEYGKINYDKKNKIKDMLLKTVKSKLTEFPDHVDGINLADYHHHTDKNFDLDIGYRTIKTIPMDISIKELLEIMEDVKSVLRLQRDKGYTFI